jgi:adenosine deaminase
MTKKALLFVAALTILFAGCQKQAVVFEQIRGTESALVQFFTQMPKGGDLHNHLTGSAYAETYFKIALEKGMWLDRQSGKLYTGNNPEKTRLQLTKDMPNFHAVYMECIDKWSARNFDFVQQGIAPDEFFFDSFGVFGTTSDGGDEKEYLATLLKELRLRAQEENVSYLEIMLTGPSINKSISSDMELNERLNAAIQNQNEVEFTTLLNEIYKAWEQNSDIQQNITEYVQFINDVHEEAKTTAPAVTSYYQGYAGRNAEPVEVFAQLYICFASCTKTPLLVGVNILQPENGENSLRDYWGHMRMFRYLKEKLPVNTSLHAGELRLGLVPPEDLKFHIHDAIFVAGADRIGHGIDIAFETESQKTLDYMAANNKVIEISLTSSEFILGVKDGTHPFPLYYKNKVPVVLSTDDAGILRTNLTEQYVLAALRYPKLTYKDFKQFSFNSIKYSFLPDDEKERLLADLTARFAVFEK